MGPEMASSAMTVAALIFSLFSLSNSINTFPLSSHYRSIGRPSPPFPSSLIKPELLKPTISYSSEKVYYEIKYFTQTLDHFNYVPWGYETFQQRYLINSKYWGGPIDKAPIFVYTGNEGDVEWFAQNTGFMFENAPYFKALLVFIEHRYYGESIPYGSEEIAYKNASTHGYLSSAQALADYAMLIIDLKKNLSAEDSPVVVMGGSYGGMLATWFRLKYPHVCIGALASSAPILNFADITSPYSFNNIVTEDFRSESENCYKVIKNSWQKIHETAQQPGGLEELRKSFRICPNYISEDSLTNWLERAFIYTAMTDYPVPSSFLAPLPAFPIEQMCKAVDDAGDEQFKGIYEAANIFYNYTGDSMCFNLSDNSDRHGLNGWGFQACTEMLLATGGRTQESIFPPYTYNYTQTQEYCQQSYGINPRPHWITTHFGGHDIKRVLKRFGSNIIFFNGLRDPWSGGGVLENLSDSIVALVAKEGAHHIDLRFSTEGDPMWLSEVRKREIHILSMWLEQYYKDIA
ncbi:hypothetical protein AMTRI_Chr11g95870 [Amborella trichopoda]|uniref:Lysosomal Pro-X carboxypeptidase n=1 Tax=Amborella trichopoda TaxID=13333 RepID=U5D1A6_AMBTC|nr:lysosomal Pro-X carboxypeptidase [Amborella trichopoda]ERN16214.1 hypothetical protein AMTR_s00030p00247420 [Amborella trichopoda]|eukprot:XP_006854747.1 lysosomal Pro-X carboxypeptidase [Amborella trichopoda]